MLSYSDVKTFLTDGLADLGYTDTLPAGLLTMPRFDPGPFSIQSILNAHPGPVLVATVGNGAGLTLEHTYDQVFITVRIAGPQNNYEGAERLAYDVDRLFLGVSSPATIGDTRVLYVVRTGGAPQLIDFDSAERYHFQTTYITPAATGL